MFNFSRTSATKWRRLFSKVGECLIAFKERHPRTGCVGAVLANWGDGLENKQRQSSLV